MTQDIQDIELQHVVEAQLHADKTLDSADITVALKDRVATLAGFTRSFRQRRRAVAAVERVRGVAAIVDDIEVRLPLLHRRTLTSSRWRHSTARSRGEAPSGRLSS